MADCCVGGCCACAIWSAGERQPQGLPPGLTPGEAGRIRSRSINDCRISSGWRWSQAGLFIPGSVGWVRRLACVFAESDSAVQPLPSAASGARSFAESAEWSERRRGLWSRGRNSGCRSAGSGQLHIQTIEPLTDARVRSRLQLEGKDGVVAALLHLHIFKAAPAKAALRAWSVRFGNDDIVAVAAAIGRIIVERRVGCNRDARAFRSVTASERRDVLLLRLGLRRLSVGLAPAACCCCFVRGCRRSLSSARRHQRPRRKRA